MRLILSRCLSAVALLVCFAQGSLWADDLAALAAEYKAALSKVGGAPRDRAAKVDSNLKPVLAKIAAVGSAEAAGFLFKELDGSQLPEVQAAVAEALVKTGDDRATAALVNTLSRRPAPVQTAALSALKEAKGDLKPIEGELLRFAAGRLTPDVRGVLVEVLGKLGTVPAAKAMLAQIQPSPARAGGKGGGDGLQSKVVAALKGTKSEEVKEWLGGAAFSAAAGPEQLAVVTRLAGELGLEGARAELRKLVGNHAPEVAAAAIGSLAKLGIGDDAEAIAEALDRGGKMDLNLRMQALDALAGAGTSSALDVVIKAAGSKDPETRAVAIGSLARAASNPAALTALLGGLEDRDPSVRNVTLRSLYAVRERGMVAPLIGVLEHDEDESFKVKVLELLVAVTGQNYGLEAEDWKKWWDISKDKFAFAKGTVTGATRVQARSLEYFGIEISSKRFGFVVDISGSMREQVAVRARTSEDDKRDEDEKGGGTTVGRPQRPEPPRGDGKDGGGTERGGRAMKIEVLKRELVRVLRKLPGDTLLNLVTFHGAFEAWQKNLQPIAGAGRQKVIDFVEGLNTGQGTNVFDSLEFVLADKRVDTIYILTDGLPTRGKFTAEDDILREVGRINRVRGVTIHAIAFGAESEFLKKLAEQNGGKYRFVDSY